MPSKKKNNMTNIKVYGDDYNIETLCIHGVGHGPNSHTCDGCCGRK